MTVQLHVSQVLLLVSATGILIVSLVEYAPRTASGLRIAWLLAGIVGLAWRAAAT